MGTPIGRLAGRARAHRPARRHSLGSARACRSRDRRVPLDATILVQVRRAPITTGRRPKRAATARPTRRRDRTSLPVAPHPAARRTGGQPRRRGRAPTSSSRPARATPRRSRGRPLISQRSRCPLRPRSDTPPNRKPPQPRPIAASTLHPVNVHEPAARRGRSTERRSQNLSATACGARTERCISFARWLAAVPSGLVGEGPRVCRIAQRLCPVIGVADDGSAAVYPIHVEGWRRIPDSIAAAGSCQIAIAVFIGRKPSRL
jgi:hypothetical protein